MFSRKPLIIVLIALCAFAFRVPRLEMRPMHCDEAVHAFKAGALIEHGTYVYDPSDYHGPTIYYFALPFIWLSGAKTLADTNEFMFRIVPVIFGSALILLLLLVTDGVGVWPAIVAGVLTAISPMMVFYSRYYIQEMLLVFFTFGAIACGWRFFQSRKFAWLVAAAACIGFMQSTKETSILAYGAMAGGIVGAVLWSGQLKSVLRERRFLIKAWHLPIVAGTPAIIVAVFMSGFFTNPRGMIDAVRTYLLYRNRAGGVGIHEHPWYYYLSMLLYTKEGPLRWSEGLILGLAAVGLIAVVVGKRRGDQRLEFLRFLAVYTLLLTGVYAVIPYKTPWCALSFFHGMILMAGVGAVALIEWVPTRPGKVVVALLLALAAVQLGQQAYRANYRYYADPRNPYVYAHTSNDVLRFAKRAEDIAKVSPDGQNMLIKVITQDQWPLPWYLRKFKHVGYGTELLDDPDASIIVTAQELEPEVEAKLKGQYKTEYYGLRPEVLMAVFIRQDLWDAYMRRR